MACAAGCRIKRLAEELNASFRELCSTKVFEGPLKNPHICTPQKSQALGFCYDRGHRQLREHWLSRKTWPLFFLPLPALTLKDPETGKRVEK